jgi:hypothetical protein
LEFSEIFWKFWNFLPFIYFFVKLEKKTGSVPTPLAYPSRPARVQYGSGQKNLVLNRSNPYRPTRPHPSSVTRPHPWSGENLTRTGPLHPVFQPLESRVKLWTWVPWFGGVFTFFFIFMLGTKKNPCIHLLKKKKCNPATSEVSCIHLLKKKCINHVGLQKGALYYPSFHYYYILICIRRRN